MSVRSYRAAMIAGAASALLLFFGMGTLAGVGPNTKKSDSASAVAQKWLAVTNDSGKRTSVVIGSFLLVLGAIALIWFASALRSRLAGPSSPMFGFAVFAAVGAAASMAGPLALVGGHTFGSDPLPADGNVVWFLFSAMFPLLLVMFGIGVAAFLASVAVAGRGVLPMWLVVFAWIAVIGGLLGVEFIPLLVVFLWLLVAGIYGAVRPAAPAAVPAATAA